MMIDKLNNLEVEERLVRKYEKLYTSVFKNSQEASLSIAIEISNLIKSKESNGENCVLGLATGSSPIGVYNELVRMHKEDGLSFKNVITFNLDEYYSLQKNNEQSYWHFMHEHLFDHVDIPKKNIHVPDGMIEKDQANTYCQYYETAIKEAGGIDIQLLGIGRTGHIGFNEPGSGINSPTRMIALDSLTIADASGDFHSQEQVPTKALTMGVGTIMSSKRVILMAWGEKKSSIIKKAIEGPIIDTVPATYLQKHPNVEFILDKEAAKDLVRFKTPWLVRDVEWDDRLIRRATLWLCKKIDKSILKLTSRDYNDNNLGDMTLKYGSAYDINLKVFKMLQKSLTGWPGGKPNDNNEINRPARALPFPKKILIFSPHPADDMLAMGGTINRLVEQGHEVHIAYQTSGNISITNDATLRYIYFAENALPSSNIDLKAAKISIANHESGNVDSPEVRDLKRFIREAEALMACKQMGIAKDYVHFLKMPFYETGTIKKANITIKDIDIIVDIIQKVKPHQIYAAGDLTDPHGTHRKCFNALDNALDKVKSEPWIKDCVVWLYHGTWKEWDIADVDMAVPVSPEELKKKRAAIFHHSSQKEIIFPGEKDTEIWRYAIARNRKTARKYDNFGMAEYEGVELFVRYEK